MIFLYLLFALRMSDAWFEDSTIIMAAATERCHAGPDPVSFSFSTLFLEKKSMKKECCAFFPAHPPVTPEFGIVLIDFAKNMARLRCQPGFFCGDNVN